MMMGNVKHKVIFNMTLEQVLNAQKEIMENLHYGTKCIYSFIEESHNERIQATINGFTKFNYVYYYTMIIVSSNMPISKEELISVLDKIPNGTNKKFSRRKSFEFKN